MRAFPPFLFNVVNPFLTVFTIDSLCFEAHFSSTFGRVLRRDGWGVLIVYHLIRRLPAKKQITTCVCKLIRRLPFSVCGSFYHILFRQFLPLLSSVLRLIRLALRWGF